MDLLLREFSNFNNFLWDRLGLVLIFSSGVILSLMIKFFQITHSPLWIKVTLFSLFKKDKLKEKSSITRFQAICTTLASSVGVGNIVGVATAISSGGSGTVFWMWVAAFFGMAVSYGENILCIYFRKKDKKGNWIGGPMQVLKQGFINTKFPVLFNILGILFCIFCVLASFGIGNLSQVNAITENLTVAFPFLKDITFFNLPSDRLFIALCLTVSVCLIITGGLNSVAKFTEKAVPVMVFLFIFCTLSVIMKNHKNIIPVLKDIINSAFSVSSVNGYVTYFGLKEVIKNGFKRGLFSNEAGLGSAPIINATSEIIEPAEQGMWGIFQVFCDTVIICSLTAFAILTSKAHLSVSNPPVMASFAFSSFFGSIGEKIVAVCIFLFAFTSILGWSQYGIKTIEFLNLPFAKEIYLILFVSIIPIGCFITPETVLSVSDMFNGLMMIPNLISVICLSPLIIKISNNYLLRQKNKPVSPLLSFDKDIERKYRLKIIRLKNQRM